jgi:hypothetical protein
MLMTIVAMVMVVMAIVGVALAGVALLMSLAHGRPSCLLIPIRI